jgi:outer membrane protein, multidrug efflux system
MRCDFLWHSRGLIYLTFGLPLLLLSSCQLLDPYKSPPTPTPDQWKNAFSATNTGQSIMTEWKNQLPAQITESQASQKKEVIPPEPTYDEVRADLTNWWEVFHDPILNILEEEALNNSYTLWAALERVVQNRALAAVQQASLYPGLTFNPIFNRSGQLLQNPIGALGGGSNNCGNTTTVLTPLSSRGRSYSSQAQDITSAGTTTAAAANGLSSLATVSEYRFVQSEYLLPLNLNYEIDLWGRLTNAYYATLVRAQAASAAYRNVLLSLTADIASSYFQIRGLDAQLVVIEKNIRTRQEEVDINQSRYNSGLVAFVDVSRAQTELALAKSDRDDTQRLRGLQENMLAALIGTPAPIFNLQANPVFITPPRIPTGLPSELLCRRPDIAEAERTLASFYYEIGVAKANFFPSLSLNAALGLESPFAHSLFKWKARFWEIGLNAMQTVFDAGRNQANFEYYQALYRESFSNYQQTVVNAFQDVENALVNLRFYAQQSIDLAEAVKAASLTFDLSQLRYKQGLVNYLDVVDAERRLLQAEQNATIVLENRYVATVQLVRALGGGWGPL